MENNCLHNYQDGICKTCGQLDGDTIQITLADISDLAHELTIRECDQHLIKVNCESVEDCKDEGQDHSEEADGTHYSETAQEIYNQIYDAITNTLRR